MLAVPLRRRLLIGLSQAALPVVLWMGSLPARATDPRTASTAQPTTETISVIRAQLELQFASSFSPALQSAARRWASTSADAVARYFGRFPVPKVELLLVPEDGSGVHGGVTYGEPSLLIRIRLGLVGPARVWRDWASDMLQGQLKTGDAGLDHTPIWGRAYWGGALFCLMAAVVMLKRSGQRLGLQHALQGVLAAGGHYGVSWPVDRFLRTADTAVGQTTLTDLYARRKDSPEPMDLDGLWRSLGVDGGMRRDNAPLAKIRRAILS